jgi:hypothetical protein
MRADGFVIFACEGSGVELNVSIAILAGTGDEVWRFHSGCASVVKEKARTRRTRTEAPRSAWDTDTAGRARLGRWPSGCVSVVKKFAVSCATFRLR